MHYSLKASVFQGRKIPEEGTIVGYAAIIYALDLELPTPSIISLISTKNRKYKKGGWNVLTPKHNPEDSLYKYLVFALKHEGINLLFFKKLFSKLSENEIIEILKIEPTGQYSRKIWFLYEWLFNKKLDISNADVKIKYTQILGEKLQYSTRGINSPRHRIINNLPGTRDFCPLIFKTEKLNANTDENLTGDKNNYLKSIHKDVLQRASAFLLLRDSKASFTIEGEKPGNNRAMRWGRAIGQAGSKPLSKDELVRLQQIVIENSRFTRMGFRKKGGFVGDHDRITGEPIPDHISARWQDLDQLTEGLLATSDILETEEYDPILAATTIAFGFVFIHPFEDGNGRIHRYLIHHMLARKNMTQQGVIFPVSASILNHIDDYRKVLEDYSHPLLDYIKWKETSDHNVKVTNETIDYYRYYDATKQAEFMYACVEDTIEHVIPQEVRYLQHYDEFKKYIDNTFEMPDNMVALLVRFLEQNDGQISTRAKKQEFEMLSQQEIKDIENCYSEIFMQE